MSLPMVAALDRGTTEIWCVSKEEKRIILDAREVAIEAVAARLALSDTLDKLAKVGALAIRIPKTMGGKGETPCSHLALNDALSEASCTIAFLVQQHNGVSALLALNSEAEPLLVDIASGVVKVGPAASHLRHNEPGVGLFTTQGIDGRWLVNGKTRYVSGSGIFTHVLLAARSDVRGVKFFLQDFQEIEGMRIVGPLPLWVLDEARTVEIHCDNLTVPPNYELGGDLKGYYSQEHPAAFSQSAAFALGLTRRVIGSLAAADRSGVLARDLCRMQVQLLDISRRFYLLSSVPSNKRDGAINEALSTIRINAAHLAISASLAAMAIAGGRGQAINHSSNQALREATFFVATTVNDAVKTQFAQHFLQYGNLGNDGQFDELTSGLI